MAKTASQIAAEREKELAEISAIQASRDAIEAKQREDPSAYKSFSQRRDSVDMDKIQEYVNDQAQEIASDREDAAKIREEAIAAGTWKTAGSTEPAEETQSSESSFKFTQEQIKQHEISQLQDAGSLAVIPKQASQLDGSSLGNSIGTGGVVAQIINPGADDSEAYTLVIGSIVGFILGIVVMFIFLKIRIKKIKAKHEEELKKLKTECDIKVTEARSALDRMLIIASQK